MRKRAILIVLATTGAAVLAAAGAAHADVPVLYVNNDVAANCSDGGSGTQAQPFCTLAAGVAAVSAGQTLVVGGAFNEHVTISRSGTSGNPITIKGDRTPGHPIGRLQGGPDVGFTIDGQHDIVISDISVINAATGPGYAISNSARITLQGLRVQTATTAAIPAITLKGVTGSTLSGVIAGGSKTTVGIALDAATSGVRIERSRAAGGMAPGSRGIEILGSGNSVISTDVLANTIGIAVGAGAADNVLANNDVSGNTDAGIDSTGARGTAITNNSVYDNCVAGIRVAGASTGVSVQNNDLTNNLAWLHSQYCGTSGGAEVAVSGGAVGTTVVDYNNFYHGGAPGATDAYLWNGTAMGLTAFRAASGQGAHDLETAYTSGREDAANSAAPGWQSTDHDGNPREDNPGLANTGAGPVPYADRGAYETVRRPQAAVTLRADQAASTVTADASGTIPGYLPIATYSFDFGDGTPVASQASAVAAHHYAKPGTYTVTVSATDTHGYTGSNTAGVSVWPAVRTIALLGRENNAGFVTGGASGYESLTVNGTAAALFDVVDPGNGHVALRARANGQYVHVRGSSQYLVADGLVTDDTALFDLVTNADASVSLRSVFTLGYVSGNSGNGRGLTADRSTVGPWEQFGVVDQANANVTLHAHANGKYVTADNGGNSPLIANRTATGQWETFDLVDAGNGYVGLYSHANGRFVTADNGGNAALIANRTTVGAWEKFKIVKNADGSTALQASINGKYVTADNGGNSPLIANRTAVGAWESFDR
ncbi:PKD domain-containing protein [Dactylosporangium sp. CS-047395]|uniref:PKD domain-containing protein n=1 Tax=Dactylosporangium sp. CS-047395 TaxID=3239936 RepID=UPI003D8F7357